MLCFEICTPSIRGYKQEVGMTGFDIKIQLREGSGTRDGSEVAVEDVNTIRVLSNHQTNLG